MTQALSRRPGARTFGALALGALAALVADSGASVAQEPLSPVIGASSMHYGEDPFVFQCLMGAVTGAGAFLGYEEAAPRLKSRASIGWFDLAGGQGTGVSGAAAPMDPPCDFAYTTDATLNVGADGNFLGLAVAEAPMPATLSLHSPQSRTYTAAAAEFFASIGHVTDAVTLTQVIRTDLEGDGVEEVILTVHDDADGLPTTIDPGDHAAILLRRVVDGVVETVVVEGEFHAERHDFAAPLTFEVFAVADLNGDGVMEIVASVDYYEGSSFAAYRLDGAAPDLVLSCGCGA